MTKPLCCLGHFTPILTFPHQGLTGVGKVLNSYKISDESAEYFPHPGIDSNLGCGEVTHALS